MSSRSLLAWHSARSVELDEVETAHARVGGARPGRRHATRQVNHAYAVLLAAQFQGFCRDFHTECAGHFVMTITPIRLKSACRESLLLGRKLDRGNPNSGNIGSDFGRFGLTFWDAVKSLGVNNQLRKDRLDELNNWRNAIAHQDFTAPNLGKASLRLGRVQGWRRACNRLAMAFDEAMRRHIQSINGPSPW